MFLVYKLLKSLLNSLLCLYYARRFGMPIVPKIMPA